MAESSIQSDPVFIDVTDGQDQYPISIAVSDAPPVTAESLLEEVKAEPACKTERSTSPLSNYLNIQPRRIRCTECSKYTAETEEKMLRHVRKVHRGENPFQCYMCDYSTYNKSLFEEHVRIHQGIKPFKCSHCPYRSASKKNTKKHELIHRPDNPLICPQCDFIARHHRSLQCHINSEHKAEPETINKKICKLCKRRVDLKSHEKGKVKCRECDFTFCNKNLIKKHMLSVHGEKNKLSKGDFVCAICAWVSNVKPRILLHLIHHPNQTIDSTVVDVTILKQCGIVGQGW